MDILGTLSKLTEKEITVPTNEKAYSSIKRLMAVALGISKAMIMANGQF